MIRSNLPLTFSKRFDFITLRVGDSDFFRWVIDSASMSVARTEDAPDLREERACMPEPEPMSITDRPVESFFTCFSRR